MIVDDSAHFRTAAAELLAARGLEIVGLAADAGQAIVLARDGCPDGILLDVNLSGPDGFAVAPALTAVCPRARIVLTSANLDRVSDTVLRTSGLAAFVTKDELATADLAKLFSPGDT